jgi:hypothetical protein
MNRLITRAAFAAAACLTLCDAASAQPYYNPNYGYGPAPRPMAPRSRGLNCETYTPPGLFRPSTLFTCPLPRSSPLGSLCVCNAPAEYGPETWEGRVIP